MPPLRVRVMVFVSVFEKSARVCIVNVSVRTLYVHHTFDLKIYCVSIFLRDVTVNSSLT